MLIIVLAIIDFPIDILAVRYQVLKKMLGEKNIRRQLSALWSDDMGGIAS